MDVGDRIMSGDNKGINSNGVVVRADFGGTVPDIHKPSNMDEVKGMVALLNGDGLRAQRIIDGTENPTVSTPRNTPHELTQK